MRELHAWRIEVDDRSDFKDAVDEITRRFGEEWWYRDETIAVGGPVTIEGHRTYWSLRVPATEEYRDKYREMAEALEDIVDAQRLEATVKPW